MEICNAFSHYSPVDVCDGVGVGIPLLHVVVQGHRLFILFFSFFFFLSGLHVQCRGQRGARTYNPEIKT